MNTENCHPFSVNDEVVFIHNGIINEVPTSQTESDTIVFNDLYIKPVVRAWGKEALHTPMFKGLVEKFIGFSKLAFFIKGQEEFLIYNSQLGNIGKDGVWFSNLSWKPYVTPPVVVYKHPTVKTYEPLVKVDHIEFNKVCYEEGQYVALKFAIKDKFGPITEGSKGFINATWSGNRIDVDFEQYGIVLNLHPAQLEFVTLYNDNLDQEPLTLDNWECTL